MRVIKKQIEFSMNEPIVFIFFKLYKLILVDL